MANGDTMSRKASKALGRSQQPLAGALARTSEVLSEISSVIGDLEDVVGLAFAQAEGLHQRGLGLVAVADDRDHLVD